MKLEKNILNYIKGQIMEVLWFYAMLIVGNVIGFFSFKSIGLKMLCIICIIMNVIQIGVRL